LRSVAVSAAKGNVRSHQLFVSLLCGAAADRRMATMEVLKVDWLRADSLKHALRRGKLLNKDTGDQ
jgi:hypothetical protein